MLFFRFNAKEDIYKCIKIYKNNNKKVFLIQKQNKVLIRQFL